MPLPTVLPAPPTAATIPVPQVVAAVGTILLVVVGIIVVLVLLLALTGFVAGRRRANADREQLIARIQAANTALADAHAADEGWDLPLLEAAAREAARARGVANPDAVKLVLVRVDDQPGVSDDRATFGVQDGDRQLEIVLGRTEAGWAPLPS